MIEDIEKLLRELFDHQVDKKVSEEYYQEVINQDNVFTFLARDDQDEVVAMANLYVVSLFSRKLGVIEEVTTMSKYRNMGYGSSLVSQAIDKAVEVDCDCIELCVRDDKPGVKKFYERLGFKDRNNTAMRLWIKN
jgi:ribosomal protein S18 acetylase RimI-like enzyme